MGTNYYWLQEPPCAHCGRSDEGKHIGKSSAGWCFSLHVYPEDGINDFDDWRERWGEGEIYNEYGEHVSVLEMERTISERTWPHRTSASFDFVSNHAVPGPNGLVRHRISNGHCIGHGRGTWDLIVGEFS